MKTKNVPIGPKMQNNPKFFGVPKLGGWRVPDLGKNPIFSRFFVVADVPKSITLFRKESIPAFIPYYTLSVE